jgi:hypothetical protein
MIETSTESDLGGCYCRMKNNNHKNSLLGELNITKNGIECQAKKTNKHKIWGTFLSRPGDSLTKSFRSGIRTTKDRAPALTRGVAHILGRWVILFKPMKSTKSSF